MSFSWRELKAIELALESFAGACVGKSFLWHTNNQKYAKIVQRGSTRTYLQKLALSKILFHSVFCGFLETKILKQITCNILLIKKIGKQQRSSWYP